MIFILGRWASLFLFLFVLGCSSSPYKFPSSTQHIVLQAEQAGFIMHRYATHPFLITAYERLSTSEAPIHVYIEGDGNSWKSKYRLSDNPTPRQPLALALALRDNHPNVIYLGRPCQYTPHTLDKACQAKYWSSHRYAPEVIASMEEILDKLKQKETTRFVLIGFSGGASVATLLAARRQDVEGLITVAGDLNHDSLNAYHHTSPLTGSLNPSKVANLLKSLPQQHWSGKKDPIVPVWIAQHFAQKVNNPACVKTHIVEGASHQKGWIERWEVLLKTPLTCEEEKT